MNDTQEKANELWFIHVDIAALQSIIEPMFVRLFPAIEAGPVLSRLPTSSRIEYVTIYLRLRGVDTISMHSLDLKILIQYQCIH